jgi:DNA repair protein RadA/Sms
MAKAAVNFACTECGYSAGRWFGKCPGCDAFGSLVEEAPAAAQVAVKPVLRLVEVDAQEADRISTGIPELDRVLGGGLVPASLVLVGGEPGVGKSTLLLSALGAISAGGHRRGLLVTGEESTAQVKLRAARLGGTDHVEILAETELDAVCATLERERPDVCVIDSIQTLYASELGSAPGSVGQVREAAGRLLRVAKEVGVATILVGHVTKDGAVAGPRVLEHLVDCVLQFEGDRYHAHRILRATKNRFGSTNELGVFEMTGEGLVGVPDPSELFGKTLPGEIGAAVACVLEGTRPILLEIQALVAPTDLAMPRRVGTGVDPKRLAMIVAVLTQGWRWARPTFSSTSPAAFGSTSRGPTSRSPSPSPRRRGTLRSAKEWPPSARSASRDAFARPPSPSAGSRSAGSSGSPLQWRLPVRPAARASVSPSRKPSGTRSAPAWKPRRKIPANRRNRQKK